MFILHVRRFRRASPLENALITDFVIGRCFVSVKSRGYVYRRTYAGNIQLRRLSMVYTLYGGGGREAGKEGGGNGLNDCHNGHRVYCTPSVACCIIAVVCNVKSKFTLYILGCVHL